MPIQPCRPNADLLSLSWNHLSTIGLLHELIRWSTFGKRYENISRLNNFGSRAERAYQNKVTWKSSAIYLRISENYKDLYEKNSSCHPVTFEWFSIKIHVNSKMFKQSLNLPLTHLRAQIACYKLKGDLIPVMLEEILHDSFKNFEIYKYQKDLYGKVGKPCKRTWLGGKSCYSHTNAANFRRPWQSYF